MNISNIGKVLTLSILLSFSACGGKITTNSAASKLSFPLENALVSFHNKGYSTKYTVSGDCNGTAKITDTLPISANFEGGLANTITSTQKLTFSNCLPLISEDKRTLYFDAAFKPIGTVSSNRYGFYLSQPNIPSWVKVGDAGTIGTESIYTDSTKSTLVGKDTLSYQIESDTSDTAIVNLVTKSFDSTNKNISTVQDRYRIDINGILTPISSDLQASNGSSIHIILTATNSSTSAATNSWGVPNIISNDIYTAMYVDAQVTSDNIGNVMLITPWSNHNALISGYQKKIGTNWTQFGISPTKTTPISMGFSTPKLMSDSAGNAVAAWVDWDSNGLTDRDITSHVYVRNFDAVNGWNTATVMQFNQTEFALSPNLTVKNNGTAWLVWTERTFKDPIFSAYDQYALFAAKYTVATGWGAPERVTIDYSDYRPLGMIVSDNSGNPTVMWTIYGNELYSTSKFNSAWHTPAIVAPTATSPYTTLNTISEYDIKMDGNGNAFAVWWQYIGTNQMVFTNRYIASTSSWVGSTAQPVTGVEQSYSPSLAINDSGDAFLARIKYDGQSSPAIWGTRFDHLLGWQTPVKLFNPTTSIAEGDGVPLVGMDAMGNAVIIWKRSSMTLGKYVVMGCNYDKASGWGDVQTLSDGVGVTTNLQLTVSPNGHATAIWPQDDIGNQSFILRSNDFVP